MTEYKTYPDTGCKLHPSCLECLEKKCVFEGLGIERGKKQWRDKEIRKRFKEGESIADLMVAFGISKWTIRRALRG